MKTVTNFRNYEQHHHAYNEKPVLEFLDFLDNQVFHFNVAAMLLSSITFVCILFYLAFLGVY